MSGSAAGKTPVIVARNLAKKFSGRFVLQDVDLDIQSGEVHGLVGENGSGKSTIIKILAGYHRPEDGAALYVRDEAIDLPLNSKACNTLGLSFVHQDLGLVESGTIVENFCAGAYETRAGGRISWRHERARTSAALERFGLDAKPEDLVSSLRDVERALLAIVRAFERLKGVQRGLLVLDEATAYLPRDGVDHLFAAIRKMTTDGHGVLFVTHRLEEILSITDRTSVLRDGRLVHVGPTKSMSERELIGKILGFELDELYPIPHEPRAELMMTVRELSGVLVQDLELNVAQGEIIGLTGLLGMGYEEVPQLLFGGKKARSGTLSIGEQEYQLSEFSPRQAIASGIALLPANRLRESGSAQAKVLENVTLPSLSTYFSNGFLRRRQETRQVQTALDRFDVYPPEPHRPLSTLSGGNQQKALVAKWFETDPRVLLLHEPTQGVDVGARRQIFQQIRDAAQAGQSVLLSSSEYEHLPHICDRVLIFRDGYVTSELHGADLTHERIVEQCFRERRTIPV